MLHFTICLKIGENQNNFKKGLNMGNFNFEIDIIYPCNECNRKRKEVCDHFRNCTDFYSWFYWEWLKIQKIFKENDKKGENNFE